MKKPGQNGGPFSNLLMAFHSGKWSTSQQAGFAVLIAIVAAIMVPVGLAFGPLAIVAGMFVPFSIVGWFRTRRLRDSMKEAPHVGTIATLREGYVSVIGQAAPADNQVLRDPVTDEPCVWFEIQTFTRVRTRATAQTWTRTGAARSSRAFLVTDSSGSCRVSPEGAEVYVPISATVPDGDTIEHRVCRIRKGDRVCIVGKLVDRAHGVRVIKDAPDYRFVISDTLPQSLARTTSYVSLQFLALLVISLLVLFVVVVYHVTR